VAIPGQNVQFIKVGQKMDSDIDKVTCGYSAFVLVAIQCRMHKFWVAIQYRMHKFWVAIQCRMHKFWVAIQCRMHKFWVAKIIGAGTWDG
jgi:expansin (peptidoglycan-binding protein)